MGAVRRFLRRMAESDEERLAEELRAWASSIDGATLISEAKVRTRVKVAGVVRRITIRPVEGFEALEAVISDGSGEVSAVWLGRRSIPGLLLGSRLILVGVLGKEHGELRMVNPTFEFA
ncbi:MAG TPA: DNA-binding protein [Actinomycetota bacterium]|nr:DNA-binding protein [Actinomycetota bacterium]